MTSISKIITTVLLTVLISACNNQPKPAVETDGSKSKVSLQTNTNKELIEGVYKTQPESDNSDKCQISIEISKTKTSYSYFLKTKIRELKGIANLTTNDSGEKIIVLEGIEWDEYEGDISREEENDSIADSGTNSQELKIPVGIGASYTKDTLTIQNYGNAMNSYTKLSECGRKYIQLIKK